MKYKKLGKADAAISMLHWVGMSTFPTNDPEDSTRIFKKLSPQDISSKDSARKTENGC